MPHKMRESTWMPQRTLNIGQDAGRCSGCYRERWVPNLRQDIGQDADPGPAEDARLWTTKCCIKHCIKRWKLDWTLRQDGRQDAGAGQRGWTLDKTLDIGHGHFTYPFTVRDPARRVITRDMYTCIFWATCGHRPPMGSIGLPWAA